MLMSGMFGKLNPFSLTHKLTFRGAAESEADPTRLFEFLSPVDNFAGHV